eukprot:m.1041146 g.1041146  ORF g.1041146 m.1041146 type:complete len:1572 (-) comp24157_c0_seq4:1290-6005(-)
MTAVSLLGLLVAFQCSVVDPAVSLSPCCTPPAVNAACWLKHTKNDVDALQAAVNCAAASEVYIGGERLHWNLSDTLHLNSSNQRIVLEYGVVLEAQRGEFHATSAVLVSISNAENVTLSGYGATLKMWKEDYSDPKKYLHSEWRHAVSITSSRHITIEGIHANASGGDGIYIGGDGAFIDQCNATGELCDSKDVVVRDCDLTNNYRNAMSVTGVVNLSVQRTLLALSNGTCCMGGVDLEPETPLRQISNVTFSECVFENNSMTQVTINLGGQQNVSDGIVFDSCIVRNSPAAGIWVLGVQPFAPEGIIRIKNTTISNTSDFGLRINKETADGVAVEVVNSAIYNVAQRGHWPILIQGGGLLLSNVSVRDSQTRPWLEVGWRSPRAVTGVQGAVSVWTPTGKCAVDANYSRGDRIRVQVACHRLAAPMLTAPSLGAAQVVPHCDDADCSAYVIYDAENISVSTYPKASNSSSAGWTAQSWAHDPNLFASDVSNVFHNRRAYLHASADALQGSTATAQFPIPQHGQFHVLLRYEAGYRFNSPFRVTVKQRGAVVFSKVYGLRSSLRVWSFGGCGPTQGQGIASLVDECRRNYGTSENMVWEGVHDTVGLSQGSATVSLTVVTGRDGEYHPVTERNVDTVVLTSNTSDLLLRLNATSRPLNLDGLIGTQHGEVLAKLESLADTAMSVTLPRTYSRSPLWKGKLVLPVLEHTQVHTNKTHVVNTTRVISGCGYTGLVQLATSPLRPLPAGLTRCVTVSLAPRAVSPWVDVGRLLDSLNHAAWNLPQGNYSITLALADQGSGAPSRVLGRFVSSTMQPLTLLVDASTRASRRIRPRAADFWALFDALQRPNASHTPPVHVPVFATTFQRDTPHGGGGPPYTRPDPAYQRAQRAFEDMFGLSPMDVLPLSPGSHGWRTPWGYLDLRALVSHPTTLAQTLRAYVAAGLGAHVRVVKLGDEVNLPRPAPSANTDAAFRTWARARNLSASAVGCANWTACVFDPSWAGRRGNPRHFYYANLYGNDFGLAGAFRNATTVVSSVIPTAVAGANYAPNDVFMDTDTNQSYVRSYLPETYKWIRAMRAGTFTLPFTEDYVFQIPVGTQQMFSLVVDVERAAVRRPVTVNTAAANREDTPLHVCNRPLPSLPLTDVAPARPIMQYVMAHFPGTTPRSWRRQFYADLAHGVKFINLYQFAPAFSSVAGDYVDPDGGTYQAVLAAVNELSMFDDIIAAGSVLDAKVALLFSESGDIWKDTYGTAGAAKRALYIALKHAQLLVDVVTETDIEDGILNSYGVLYLANAHMRRTAADVVATWVAAGGTAVSCAGGGLYDEFNHTHPPMLQLFGIVSFDVFVGARGPIANRVDYIKQDLPYSEKLDTVYAPVSPPWRPLDTDSVSVRGRKLMWVLNGSSGQSGGGGGHVTASYASDESPAIVRRSVGRGAAVAIGFDIGLAYFAPAVPARPVARGSHDMCFNHFVPTAFATIARTWAVAPTAHVQGAAPVHTSEALVDVGVVSASGVGVVLPVVNWSPGRVRNFTVSLGFPTEFSRARLATGSDLRTTREASGFWSFQFDLDVADAIVLRV